MQIRLDKFIADMAKMTRTEAKAAISGGRVSVNGTTVKKPETKVTDEDKVAIDGRDLNFIENIYIMLNKPDGVVSATEDNRDKTVVDLVRNRMPDIVGKRDIFPMGRLDKDTEGLIVISNDGKLSHELLSPAKHVPKTYYAKCEGRLADNAAELFSQGINVGSEYTAKPAKLEIISNSGDESELKITLTEGRFHQVKRMCHEVGAEVKYLKRIKFGNLVLPDDLAPGEARLLTEEEIQGLTKRTR